MFRALKERLDTGLSTERFSGREAFRPAYETVADSLCGSIAFNSCLDVGSGQGFLVDALLDRGKDVLGVEVSERAVLHMSEQAKERIEIANAIEFHGPRADLVACIEVAEHIEPEDSEPLCDALVRHTRKWLLFTAAGPFQPGPDHINLRPMSHWMYFLHQRGMEVDLDRTVEFLKGIGPLPDAPWIAANALVFKRA